MSAHKPPDSAAPESLDALFDRIETQVEAEQGWRARLREMSRSRAGVLAVGLMLGLAGGWFYFAPRTDLQHYPAARWAIELCALGLLAASAGWTFVRPLSESQPSLSAVRFRMLAHLVVAAAIRQAGVVLSQPVVSTTPSSG